MGALELAETVLTDDQRAFLQAPRSQGQEENETMLRHINGIQKAAMQKMMELEGKKKTKAQPFVTGLGKRWNVYKANNASKEQPSLSSVRPTSGMIQNFFKIFSPTKNKENSGNTD